MGKLWQSILFLVLALPGVSQSIWTNPITGTNPNTANPYTAGQTFDANITVSGISRGSGITGTAANDRYNATGWNIASIDLTDYFEFTLTPNSGCEIDFTSFVYTAQASGTGPGSFALRSSVDGYIANIGTPTAAGVTISLAGAAYQNITSAVTFRLYAWGASAAGGTFSVNSFTFNGTTSCGAPCTPPATQSSSLSSTPVSCNSVTLNWVRGDGNAVLVTGIGGASSTTAPANGTAYTGNSSFTAGTAVGGGYAVYTGSGTAVTVTGLAGNTQYTFAVYEYASTGTCYLSTPVTVTFTTSACAVTQCAYITSVLVNSCDGGGCDEGDNEMIFINTGSSPLNTAPANVQTYYGNTVAPATNYSESFTTNAATIAAMNTAAGCGSLFIDAGGGTTIPANSSVLLVKHTMCQNSYDWTALCGSGPVYVLFSTDASWAVGGNFVNSGGIRYFRTTYAGCVTDYSYDSNLLTGGNGAYIVYGTSGGAPAGYFNSGCALSVIVLPLNILDFSATKNNASVRLQWVVSQGSAADHFGIERSSDGILFAPFAAVDAHADVRDDLYTLYDEAPLGGTAYYRLYSVEKDGTTHYHKTISFDFSGSPVNAYTITYSGESVLFRVKEAEETADVSLYTLSGQEIKKYAFDPADKGILKIAKGDLEKGIYLIRLRNGKKVYNDKLIIQ